MTLWWMRPGWADAACGQCGAHIQQSGGDPDWGLCWPCMQYQTSVAQADREYEAAVSEDRAVELAEEAQETGYSTVAIPPAVFLALHAELVKLREQQNELLHKDRQSQGGGR